MRKALIVSLISAASIFLMTCGESDIKPGPTPGPGNGLPDSGPITDEQRLAVLKECADFVNALGNLKSEVAQQVLVAWLKARPEFEEADMLDGNVWAYFHDGRLAMFVPNWLSASKNEGGRIAQSSDGGRVKISPSTGRTSGQPGSNEVKLFYGLGRAFRDYRPLLKSIFTKSKTDAKTQYNVTLEEASIENLKNTNDLGIFFIDTHGGLGFKKPLSERKTIFGLWTTDTTSLANERRYEADLNSYYLAYMLAVQHDTTVTEWHYAITDNFVRNHAYMNLAENALVYIDACNGMGPNSEEFRKSIVNKAKGGKATYVGWTSVTDGSAGEAAAGYIFDRMLATNMDINAQVSTIAAEDPKQRPFDFKQVFNELGNFVVGGYPLGVSRHGGKLAYYSTNTTEIILTPSIEYIGINDFESTMYIKGIFGDYNAADRIVKVGGVSVPIRYWTKNLIMCDLPTVGPGSIGDVIVSVGDNKSNVVPLSEWIIPIDLLKDELGIKLTARLNLRIRADLHPYRSKPTEAPKMDRPDTLGILGPNSVGWPFAIGSTGNFNIGGQWHANCQIEKCQIEQTQSAVSRNGVLPYLIGASSGLGFGAYYKWSVDMKTLYVTLYVTVPDVGYETRSRIQCEGRAPVNNDQSINTEVGIQIPLIDLSVLQLHVDENYNLLTGGIENAQEFKWGLCLQTENVTVSAKWPDVRPAFPPQRDTEARFGGD